MHVKYLSRSRARTNLVRRIYIANFAMLAFSSQSPRCWSWRLTVWMMDVPFRYYLLSRRRMDAGAGHAVYHLFTVTDWTVNQRLAHTSQNLLLLVLHTIGQPYLELNQVDRGEPSGHASHLRLCYLPSCMCRFSNIQKPTGSCDLTFAWSSHRWQHPVWTPRGWDYTRSSARLRLWGSLVETVNVIARIFAFLLLLHHKSDSYWIPPNRFHAGSQRGLPASITSFCSICLL
jgi:hypothetical protein